MTELSKTSYTPKQVAQAIGVSEASIKRWCDKGILGAERTGGGHRRIRLDSVVAFLLESQCELIRPDIIGLPSNTGKGHWTLERSQKLFLDALQTGDQEKLFSTFLNLYLDGHSFFSICDRVIAKSFEILGQKWQHGELEIYQERRGIEITQRILYQMQTLIRQPQPDSPLAIGGTLSMDQYSLAGQMVQLCLQELGWRAEFLGCDMPGDALAKAIVDLKPNLFWLNVNVIQSQERFYLEYKKLLEITEKNGIALVVGGRALVPEIRNKITYSAFCDNMEHLKNFVNIYRVEKYKTE